jgi:hypothetical protein
MNRPRLAGPTALVALLAALVVAAPASAADVVLPFTNYKVGGTIGLANIGQNVTLPAGSTFNGSADITTGQLSGHVTVPEFTAPIKVLGIPTRATLRLVEAQPVQGRFSLGAGGTVTVKGSTSAVIQIRKLGLGILAVPTTCRTAAPVVLGLNTTGPISGLAFDGVTTVPWLTGCGPLGPTLSLLLSGPGNPYHLTLAPPS